MPAIPRLLLSLAVLGLCLAGAGCHERDPVKLGFVGGLTGRVAGLGVAGRDGALFAVEEQNRRGGIDGRPLELVVRDDQQDPDTAERVVRELIAADVTAIIGPMTSSMAMVMQPLVDQAGVVMVSPTVKTDLLSARDDYFLRVTPPLSANAGKLAEYAVSDQGLRRFAVVYDDGNRAFTKTWVDYFESFVKSRGGELVAVEAFRSGPTVSFLDLAKEVRAAQPQAILVLANAMDTAMFSQQVRKLGMTVPMFTAEWSFTSDVIGFGGQAVEGMVSYHSFNADCRTADYLAFKQAFADRFGYRPSFATVLAHDATRLVIAALAKNPDPGELKSTLLGLGRFRGLQSDIRFDRYGDVERPLFQTTIRDGQFVVDDGR